jgi:hypothetical protein
MPNALIPPTRAALIPTGASSTTRQFAGAMLNSAAASKNISGFGLPCCRSRPQTFALNTSSKLRPDPRRMSRII